MINQHQHSSDNCHRILSQLNDYADGELAPELCVELETHLKECDDCQVVLDTLSKTIYLVHHLDDHPPELPANVEQRLFAVLELDDFLTVT